MVVLTTPPRRGRRSARLMSRLHRGRAWSGRRQSVGGRDDEPPEPPESPEAAAEDDAPLTHLVTPESDVVGQPITSSVAGPYSPSDVIPARCCTSATAPAVWGPYSPSTVTPSRLHRASASCSTTTASSSPRPCDIPHELDGSEKKPVSPGTRTGVESMSMTTTPSHVGSPLVVLSLAAASLLVPKSKSPFPSSDSHPPAAARARSPNSTRMATPMLPPPSDLPCRCTPRMPVRVNGTCGR